MYVEPQKLPSSTSSVLITMQKFYGSVRGNVSMKNITFKFNYMYK